MRTERWKYIRRFGDRLTPVLPNTDDSPSKRLLLRYGWKDRPIAQEQLYDLIFDPGEACNVANDPGLAPVLDEMRSRLEQWMSSTDDPLLHGPVPAPAGAEFNDPDQLSPYEPMYRV